VPQRNEHLNRAKQTEQLALALNLDPPFALTGRPGYTFDELLAQCDPKRAPSKAVREWLDSKPAGRELL